jgi:hypothetical protein
MLLKNFGLYLIQKRYHAVWVVLLCAFLPFIKIPTFFLAVATVGLITLHKGAKEGLYLLCWLFLPSLAAYFYGDYGPLLLEAIGKGAVVWLTACILGATLSWTKAIQAAVLCGVVVVMVLHLALADLLSGWWLQQIAPFATEIQKSWDLNLPPDQIKLLLEKISHFATGAIIAGVLLFDVVILLVARGWQALLFNPGGLNREWQQLRLHYAYSLVLLAVMVLIWLDVIWLLDILPIILVPYIFAGLSLIHAKLPEKKSLRTAVLIALYMGLVLFSPYVCTMLVLIALVDSWYDFRAVRVKN